MGRRADIAIKDFKGFCQSVKQKLWIETQIYELPLPSRLYAIHYSLIFIQFDAIFSKIKSVFSSVNSKNMKGTEKVG